MRDKKRTHKKLQTVLDLIKNVLTLWIFHKTLRVCDEGEWLVLEKPTNVKLLCSTLIYYYLITALFFLC